MRVIVLVLVLALTSLSARAADLIVGVEDLDYAPYATVSDGEYGGFARAVLDAFAADAGHRLIYRPLPVNRLYKALVDGRIDLKYPDNPTWAPRLKAGVSVSYSAPVVRYVNGVMVRPELLGRAPEAVKLLGTVAGFRMPPWRPHIKAGTTRRTENANLAALIRQVLMGRIDGAYANVAVVAAHLARMKQAGSLAFDPGLPHATGSYHLSTTTSPAIVAAFDAWMAANPERLNALKAAHGIPEP